MINAIGKAMFVIDGSWPTGRGVGPAYVVRTLWGNTPDQVVARFKNMNPGISCINIDLLSRQTAKAYGVIYCDIEQHYSGVLR